MNGHKRELNEMRFRIMAFGVITFWIVACRSEDRNAVH